MPFAKTEPESWASDLERQVHDVWTFCHAALECMVRQGGGTIISLVPDCALHGRPDAAITSAAAATLVIFVQSLAQEVGVHGVRVATLAFDPEQAAERRDPALTDALAFLLSEAADHVTGSCLDATFGRALH